MVESSVIVFIVVLVIVLIFGVTLTLITFEFVPSPLLKCPAGECVVNANNGSKICPSSDSDVLQYNFLSQVCSPAKSCTDAVYSFAVRADGGTNNDGVCEENPATGKASTCRCVNQARCPIYTATAFTVASGAPINSSIAGATLVQTINPILLNSGADTSANTTGGMIINDSESTFCNVPLSWLFSSTPGCTQTSQNESQNISDCFFSNPCMQGTLAAVSNNPLEVLGGDVNTLQVACVTAPYLDSDTIKCSNTQIPIYIPDNDSIICTSFP